MFTVSMVARDWSDRNPQWIPPSDYPWSAPNSLPAHPPLDLTKLLQRQDPVTREEFDALKKELESLKKLLVAAKQYDNETGQSDCEEPEKVALFKALARICGVDLSKVFEGAK